MADFNHLGEFLRKHRLAAGLTQTEVASALGGIHSQFVSNWERGLCSPPGYSFQTLIKILKIKPESLVEAMLVDARNAIEKKVYTKKRRA